jgi:hypothetical protein
LDWADLPPDIQAAYTVLGYNQNSWDYGTEVEADTKDWADLTSEQQDAALFIGYTEFIWCGLGDEGLGATTIPTYVPSSIPTQNPTGPINNASIKPTQRTKLPSFFPSFSVVPTVTEIPSLHPSNQHSINPSRTYQPSSTMTPITNLVPTPIPTMKYWLLGVPYYPPSAKPSSFLSINPTIITSSSLSTHPSSKPSVNSPSDSPLFLSTFVGSNKPVRNH